MTATYLGKRKRKKEQSASQSGKNAVNQSNGMC
jgi:hypothetical protein